MIDYRRIARGVLLACLGFGTLASGAHAQQAHVMEGRIWDFSSSHPDFQNDRSGLVMGQVAPDLGPDGKPVWAGAPNAVFSSPEAFAQWYRDVPGVNLSMPYSIELTGSPAGSGSYSFEGYDFFPIDNQLLGNEGDRFRDAQGRPHNFHYTMQLAGEFSYQSESDAFTFVGDDDLWVFFGGRLGIDLGGVHSPETRTITGAQLRELGLSPNQSYPIDIFFAERQTDGSNFVIQTNFNIQPPAPGRAPAGEAARLTLPIAAGTELVRGERYWSPSGAHFLTLNPDGNLVVARADLGYVWGFDTQPGVEFWRVGRVVWQNDGNLAAYAADGGYIWSALTANPDPSARLLLQPDGALQIVAGDRIMWSSLPVAPPQTASGGGAPSVFQTDTGALTLAWTPEEDAPQGAPVAFVSTDGTAGLGSRSVFILQNEATGEATLVPVLGYGEETGTLVFLAPGTYTVTPPPPSIGEVTTFTTLNVSANRIMVPEGAETAGAPVVTVSFSLDHQMIPVAMEISKVRETSIELAWSPRPGIEVADYALVLTNGSVPADHPDGGLRIPLAGPGATSVVVEGLAPASEYTFTLFPTSPSGEAMPARSYTATTANPNSGDAAFAVAPNTILPVNFERLGAERIGETWVRVQLGADWIDRGSSSGMQGLDPSAIQGGGCVVGTPFLAKTDVAGDNSFYGVVDVCESSAEGVSSAIVNTDVPLSTVFSYYHLASGVAPLCLDPETGAILGADDPQCSDAVGTLAQEGSEGSDRADVPDVADLQAPEHAGTGQVQVTLLWTSGDDLDLYVTDPLGETIAFYAATSPSGGQLDIDDRGGNCGVQAQRAENVFWTDDAPRGTYSVQVRNYEACPEPAMAKVQVRIDGELIIDQLVTVGVDGPITFDLRGAALKSGVLDLMDDGRALGVNALLQSYYSARLPALPGAGTSLDLFARAPDTQRAPSVLVADFASSSVSVMNDYSEAMSLTAKSFSPTSFIECEGRGTPFFGLAPGFAPIFEHEIELEGLSLTWDVKAGVKASLTPTVSFQGEVTCDGKFEGWNVQLSQYPIPINLELKPDITVSATATVSLSGPKLELTLGMQSKGEASVKRPWWCLIPSCLELKFEHDTGPMTDFERGPVQATLEGKLTFAAGLQANLGIGVKNLLTTLKAGFSLRMFPLAAEIKAVVGTSNCIAASLGARLAVDFLAEAYLVKFGGEFRRNLYDSDVVSYGKATEFTVGTCPKD